MSKNRRLTEWFVMQCVKGSDTLGVGKKGDKPKPKLMFKYGRLDGEVKAFIKKRKEVWNILRKTMIESTFI